MSRVDDIRNHPERPSFEPEIIPPGAALPEREGNPHQGRAPGAESVFVHVNGRERTFYRSFPAPTPLGMALMLVVFLALATTLALLAFGFVLIWVPLAVLIVGIALGASVVRYFWRRVTQA